MFHSFFNIYLYIYIYFEKRTEHSAFFCKRTKRSHVFPILHKRTGRSWRPFPFFAKEHKDLYVLSRSFEKNRKERSVLLGLISRQKLKKRTGKNRTFFKRTGKNRTFWTGKNAVPNPAFLWYSKGDGNKLNFSGKLNYPQFSQVWYDTLPVVPDFPCYYSMPPWGVLYNVQYILYNVLYMLNTYMQPCLYSIWLLINVYTFFMEKYFDKITYINILHE